MSYAVQDDRTHILATGQQYCGYVAAVLLLLLLLGQLLHLRHKLLVPRQSHLAAPKPSYNPKTCIPVKQIRENLQPGTQNIKHQVCVWVILPFA
jgi:hypothetical protein